jgi:hypothetical protein
MDPAIALGLVGASDAGSDGKGAPAARNQNTAATEAEVARLSIDQRYIAGVAIVLKAEAEHVDTEITDGRVRRGVRCGACECGCSYREDGARRYDNVILILADQHYAGTVVGGSNR